jgi:hypothetical protein
MAEDPGKSSVRELINDVENGNYVIPYFQRGFEWEPSMVSDLFESILQDYYAGLLLFWELDANMREQASWDPVWGADRTDDPEKAILDGQQRISSLYYAITNPEKKFPSRKTYYRWFLDLTDWLNGEIDGSVYYNYTMNYRSLESMKTDEKREEWIEKGVMPLAILSEPDYLNSAEFGGWIEQYVDRAKGESLIPDDISTIQVSNKIQRILDYEFITTTLSEDREMQDICNIFARINKKGMNLSTFDLMNAFLYPHGIELRKRWEALDNDRLKSVDGSMNEYILKLISLHVQSYCSSKYIYNLIPGEETEKKTESGKSEKVVLVKNTSEFEELWGKAIDYAESARERVMNVGNYEFGAIKSDFIPNTTILPVLGALLWEKENREIPEPEFNRMLSRWYWSATLSEDYSGSSDTTIAKDFRDWKQWFEDRSPIERASRVDRSFIENELDLRGAARGSRYDSVLCMLAKRGAEDFFKGRTLDTGDYVEDKINDHHIFPSNVDGLDPEKSQTFSELSDSILNRTLLLDETNKHGISNKKPSKYLLEMIEREIVEDESELQELMANHFISPAAIERMLEDDFDGFIEEREKTITKHIASLLDAEVSKETIV